MSFKLVNIWNPKGGQGKSMIAVNLAAAAVEIKLKPLVICQDPQGTIRHQPLHLGAPHRKMPNTRHGIPPGSTHHR